MWDSEITRCRRCGMYIELTQTCTTKLPGTFECPPCSQKGPVIVANPLIGLGGPDITVFQCMDCGGTGTSLEGVQHHASCDPGVSFHWGPHYDNADPTEAAKPSG